MADDDEMIVDNEGDQPDNPAPDTQPDNQDPEGALTDNDEPQAPDTDEGKQPDDTPDTPDAPDEPDEDAKTPSQPAPELRRPEPIPDPGETFAPKGDYAFDIELADGTKVHVTKPEDIENLPADADFGTPANLMKAQARLNVMTSGIETERREFEANKEKYEAQKSADADLEQRITTMTAEMSYLETKGKLPSVDPKYENADWSNPEIAKQPGVKERLELLDYRAKENQERAKLGLSPMSVLEAHMSMQQEQADNQATDTRNKQAAQRKAKGAMVGSSNPTPATNIPDDMIVGEGGNVRDLNPAY